MEKYDLSKESKEILGTLGTAIGVALATAITTYLQNKDKK